METTVVCTVQVTRIIDGECAPKYPEQVFAKQIAEVLKDEVNPDNILIDSVQVFERKGE